MDVAHRLRNKGPVAREICPCHCISSGASAGMVSISADVALRVDETSDVGSRIEFCQEE